MCVWYGVSPKFGWKVEWGETLGYKYQAFSVPHPLTFYTLSHTYIYQPIDILSSCVRPHCRCNEKGIPCMSCVMLSIFGCSQKFTFFSSRMLTNTSNHVINNQTAKLSIYRTWVALLLTALWVFCLWVTKRSKDFWKYVIVIFGGIVCANLSTGLRARRLREASKKERGSILKVFIIPIWMTCSGPSTETRHHICTQI